MAYRSHIASRALTAAGAWYTAATAASLPGNWRESPGKRQISVLVTYTSGAAGGYPKIRPVWTFNAAADGTAFLGRDTTNSGTATASAPNITIDNYLTVVNLQSLTTGSAEKVAVVLDVPPNANAVKIECAEVGVTATPGTIVVDIDGEI